MGNKVESETTFESHTYTLLILEGAEENDVGKSLRLRDCASFCIFHGPTLVSLVSQLPSGKMKGGLIISTILFSLTKNAESQLNDCWTNGACLQSVMTNELRYEKS